MLTYSESADGKRITFKRALRELRRHSICTEPGSDDRTAFYLECWDIYSVPTAVGSQHWCLGHSSDIDAKHVLNWLGY